MTAPMFDKYCFKRIFHVTFKSNMLFDKTGTQNGKILYINHMDSKGAILRADF